MTVEGLALLMQPEVAEIVQPQWDIHGIRKTLISKARAAKLSALSAGMFSDPFMSDKENILSIDREITWHSAQGNCGQGGAPRRLPLSLRKKILSVSSKNVESGVELLWRAAIRFPDDSWALVEIGTLLAGKLGEFKLSFMCFGMAAMRGSGVGTLCLGDQLWRGLGVAQDRDLGGRLIARAKEVLELEVREPPQVAQHRVARAGEALQSNIRGSLQPAKSRIKSGKDGGTRCSGTPRRRALQKPTKRIVRRNRFRR
mmetsp:Transcript_44608/g.109504  ORF Transcript_44608/g.109504 Transcript_44608/m.109504 type:complete len:257 (-) Transcript_44608:201-971(-)|eukprot:CAMPEP_0198348612 /NCGR_PEP_ID=MMETSP1450-20131203/90555_1 /TAXON_ID=753684 ORGANISM="Madagascaria erythrocladiodes, Strain CCMP3234" /NCGR_SAMPLE_ID=MMETSP1450 /ASSEMBLY_ACC=CAM_ASM_001115 /LENGTH=256 /DNA_ID=CAMNT_0044054237 /DNA_START=455 /DNA_END=1225 /DNA_ORIENTATION=-